MSPTHIFPPPLLIILEPPLTLCSCIKKIARKSQAQMNYFTPWIPVTIFCIIIIQIKLVTSQIPTTLKGPFKPVTRKFDSSLRRGSDDLAMDHPLLKKNVTGNFPEQISLAISSPTSMWVSWVTGTRLYYFCQILLIC